MKKTKSKNKYRSKSKNRGQKQISVCIPTSNRRELLRKLLDSLAAQKKINPKQVEVLIANNGNGVVLDLLEEYNPRLNIKHFEVGPKPNISRCRNVCLENVTGKYLAFIDDDEYADENWLAAHLTAMRHADVSHGPTSFYADTDHSSWLLRCEDFEATGPSKSQKYYPKSTRNVMIKAALLGKIDSYFDENFGLSGGEDTEFFSRIQKSGAKFVWTESARTHEYLPETRLSLSYLLNRKFRNGLTRAQIQNIHPHWQYSCSASLFFLMRNFAGLLFNALRVSRREIVSSLGKMAFRTGLIAGKVYAPKYTQYN